MREHAGAGTGRREGQAGRAEQNGIEGEVDITPTQAPSPPQPFSQQQVSPTTFYQLVS